MKKLIPAAALLAALTLPAAAHAASPAPQVHPLAVRIGALGPAHPHPETLYNFIYWPGNPDTPVVTVDTGSAVTIHTTWCNQGAPQVIQYYSDDTDGRSGSTQVQVLPYQCQYSDITWPAIRGHKISDYYCGYGTPSRCSGTLHRTV